MTTNDHPDNRWWGSFHIPVDTAGRFVIGPLVLWIQRMRDEWRIAFENHEDHLDNTLRREIPADVGDLLDHENTVRYVDTGEADGIELSTLLADRPVVTRSDKPLHIPPGEEITVYVSSPLWVRIQAGKPAQELCELPVTRPSDTWFGPNTREGELCYASRTFHRMRLDQVPVLPHRATTSVLVRNRADSMLSLERMQVPVMNLSLYQAEDGRLWTDDVVFERTGADDFASLRTRARDSRGRWAAKATRLAAPRKEPGGNIVVRAFATLFG